MNAPSPTILSSVLSEGKSKRLATILWLAALTAAQVTK